MPIANFLPEPVALGFLGLLAAVLIVVLWSRHRLSARGMRAEPEQQISEKNKALFRLRDELERTQKEANLVANLALSLPHVVRDLNRNDLQTDDVPRLILQLADSIFQPQQILLYGVRSTKNDGPTLRELHLLAHRGIDPLPSALQSVRMGVGKIGWVGERELDMLPEDWAMLTHTSRTEVPDNHPQLKADIIGPLVHHAADGQELLGVLCVGGALIQPRHEKLMFQMVTNLGSLALVTATNMSRLRAMAQHDGLTGLLNMRSFTQDYAARALVEGESRARPFSVFIFDIDNFKNYNDTNGHPAGDDLLRRMASLIKRSIRPQDMACRYGGEEFVVGMPETGRETAFQLAEKLRQLIESSPFAHREKQPLGCVSISGGVAAFPRDGMSVFELIRHADQALYRSKESGRNRTTLYKGVEIGDPGEDGAAKPPAGEPVEA